RSISISKRLIYLGAPLRNRTVRKRFTAGAATRPLAATTAALGHLVTWPVRAVKSFRNPRPVMLAGAGPARVTGVGPRLAVTQAPSRGPPSRPPSLSPPTGSRGNRGNRAPGGHQPQAGRAVLAAARAAARFAGDLDRQAARRDGRRRPRPRRARVCWRSAGAGWGRW